MNPGQQSESIGEEFYKTELMQNGCSEADNEYITDPRYYPSGLYTNQYAVQSVNGVLDILAGFPNINDYVDPLNLKESYSVSSWNRPTIGWKLSCDAEPGKSRQDGYEAAGHTFSLSSK